MLLPVTLANKKISPEVRCQTFTIKPNKLYDTMKTVRFFYLSVAPMYTNMNTYYSHAILAVSVN